MTTNPDDALTREELEALAEFEKGPHRAIDPPPDQIKKLSDLGYIIRTRMEYRLTEAGKKRLDDFRRQSRRPTR
jgi:predicted transcriptional regulator